MKKLSIGSLILAFLGFLDASYLTILHYKNVIPPCTISGSKCEVVLTSQYATLFDIPIALFGVLFYVSVLVLLGLMLQGKRDLGFMRYDLRILKSSIFNLKSLLMILVSAGLVVSGILVYLQAFVLHAFCQYCLTSEGINILLFIAVLRMFLIKPKNTTELH